MENVAREAFVDAEPSEVWEALTSPDRLGEWFGAEVDGELAEGELVRFVAPDGTPRRAVVERVEPERCLVFRWLPTRDEDPSRVAITIDGVPDGSVVRVTETRIAPAVSPEQEIGFRALARV